MRAVSRSRYTTTSGSSGTIERGVSGRRFQRANDMRESQMVLFLLLQRRWQRGRGGGVVEAREVDPVLRRDRYGFGGRGLGGRWPTELLPTLRQRKVVAGMDTRRQAFARQRLAILLERGLVAVFRRQLQEVQHRDHPRFRFDRRAPDNEKGIAGAIPLRDMAPVLADLGLRDRARDACLIISGTTVEPETRMVAMLNLLELAAKDGHEAAFEQYRQALARESLPARIHARYYLTLAKGWEQLGRPAAAKAAAAKAISVASQHGIDLTSLNDPAPAPALPPSLEEQEQDHLRLAHVVRALEAATGHAALDRARAP